MANLPQLDSVLGWISLTSTITNSDVVGPVVKKRKLAQILSSISPTGGHKYSTSYAHTLYLLGISPSDVEGIIPLALDHPEASNLVSAPSDLPLLSTFMKSWLLRFEPNEASFHEFFVQVSISTKGVHLW